MQTIIEKLWLGDYFPNEVMPETDAYAEAKRKHHETYDKLASELQPEQTHEMEELIGHVMDEYDGIIFEAFRQGIKFGIELMENLSR